MNSMLTLHEVASAQVRAVEDGRWLLAHLLARWLAEAEAGVPVYRCLGPDCVVLLPGDYVDAFCSWACAERYRLAHERAFRRLAGAAEREAAHA